MRDYSGLVEVFKREEPKLREIQELRERAMTEAKRVVSLQREIGNQISRKLGLHMKTFYLFLYEALAGHFYKPHSDLELSHFRERLFPLNILGALRKWRDYLVALMELSRWLEVPDPPPLSLSRPVEGELVLGEGACKLKEASVRFPYPLHWWCARPEVTVVCQVNGQQHYMDLDLRNLPLLVLAYPQIKELLLEMIEHLRSYGRELERRKEKVILEGTRLKYSRKKSSTSKTDSLKVSALPPDLIGASTVDEVFEKGRPRFEEIGKLCSELKSTIEAMLALKSEIDAVLLKTGVFRPEPFFNFVLESIAGMPFDDRWISFFHCKRLSMLNILRAVGKYEDYLGRGLEVDNQLEVPEPPPLFLSQPMSWEGELILPEGVRRGRIKEVLVAYEPLLKRPVLMALCEFGGKVQWSEMERFNPLLLQFHSVIRELLRKAIGLLRDYLEKLNSLRSRLLSAHAREIFMSDL
jgi:hypothetical protein